MFYKLMRLFAARLGLGDIGVCRLIEGCLNKFKKCTA